MYMLYRSSKYKITTEHSFLYVPEVIFEGHWLMCDDNKLKTLLLPVIGLSMQWYRNTLVLGSVKQLVQIIPNACFDLISYRLLSHLKTVPPCWWGHLLRRASLASESSSWVKGTFRMMNLVTCHSSERDRGRERREFSIKTV